MGRTESRYHSGGNFYHTFLESRHLGLLEKSGWTNGTGNQIFRMAHGLTRPNRLIIRKNSAKIRWNLWGRPDQWGGGAPSFPYSRLSYLLSPSSHSLPFSLSRSLSASTFCLSPSLRISQIQSELLSSTVSCSSGVWGKCVSVTSTKRIWWQLYVIKI